MHLLRLENSAPVGEAEGVKPKGVRQLRAMLFGGVLTAGPKGDGVPSVVPVIKAGAIHPCSRTWLARRTYVPTSYPIEQPNTHFSRSLFRRVER